MEARGTARGGRFVTGFVGEQYALPEAVEALRQARRRERSGEIVRLAAVDPLNLTGVITPGPRVPAVRGNIGDLPRRPPRERERSHGNRSRSPRVDDIAG